MNGALPHLGVMVGCNRMEGLIRQEKLYYHALPSITALLLPITVYYRAVTVYYRSITAYYRAITTYYCAITVYYRAITALLPPIGAFYE